MGSRSRPRPGGFRWVGQRDPDEQRHHLRPRVELSREELDLAEVVAAIRNDCNWIEWNWIGMAIFAAAGGSDQGGVVFDEWSAKSPKYNPYTTAERWAHLSAVAADTNRGRNARASRPPVRMAEGPMNNVSMDFADRRADDKAAASQPNGAAKGWCELPPIDQADVARWRDKEPPEILFTVEVLVPRGW